MFISPASPLHAGILHPAHGTPVLGARHQGAGLGAGRRGRGTAAHNMTADSYTADTDAGCLPSQKITEQQTMFPLSLCIT